MYQRHQYLHNVSNIVLGGYRCDKKRRQTLRYKERGEGGRRRISGRGREGGIEVERREGWE